MNVSRFVEQLLRARAVALRTCAKDAKNGSVSTWKRAIYANLQTKPFDRSPTNFVPLIMSVRFRSQKVRSDCSRLDWGAPPIDAI